MDDFEKMVVENFQQYERGAQETEASGKEIPFNVLEPAVNELHVMVMQHQLVEKFGAEMLAKALSVLSERVYGGGTR